MATTIKIKTNSIDGAIPSAASLVVGELALNLFDHTLYSKDEAGTVFAVTNPNGQLTVNANVTAVATIAERNALEEVVAGDVCVGAENSTG